MFWLAVPLFRRGGTQALALSYDERGKSYSPMGKPTPHLQLLYGAASEQLGIYPKGDQAGWLKDAIGLVQQHALKKTGDTLPKSLVDFLADTVLWVDSILEDGTATDRFLDLKMNPKAQFRKLPKPHDCGACARVQVDPKRSRPLSKDEASERKRRYKAQNDECAPPFDYATDMAENDRIEWRDKWMRANGE